jgi:hypothetical protein
MHVPQARNQKLARGVDDAGAGCRLDILRDAGDTAVGDGDRYIGARRCAGRVDYGRVLENNVLRE